MSPLYLAMTESAKLGSIHKSALDMVEELIVSIDELLEFLFDEDDTELQEFTSELLNAISLDDDIPRELDETSMMKLEEHSASCTLDEDSLAVEL